MQEGQWDQSGATLIERNKKPKLIFGLLDQVVMMGVREKTTERMIGTNDKRG